MKVGRSQWAGLVEERIITNSCPVLTVLWQKFTSRTPGKNFNGDYSESNKAQRVGSSTIVFCLETPHQVLYYSYTTYGKCCMTHTASSFECFIKL